MLGNSADGPRTRSSACSSCARTRVEPFTATRRIALATGFADQAVIAIENARLFEELRESLDQQTATSDVLRTISGSSVNLESVLDTLVETVARLCRGDQSYLFRQRGHFTTSWHHTVRRPKRLSSCRRTRSNPTRARPVAAFVLHRKTVHIHDVLQDEGYSYGDGPKVVGYRTNAGIPLMVQDKIIGVFVVARARVEPFSDKEEIALATGFADQAVIAIENARLFEELRDREGRAAGHVRHMGDGVAMFDDGQRLAAVEPQLPGDAGRVGFLPRHTAPARRLRPVAGRARRVRADRPGDRDRPAARQFQHRNGRPNARGPTVG
jgi:GAF domain-containing protein